MMKNKTFPIFLLWLALALSACGANEVSTSEASTAVAELVNQGLTASAPVATDTPVKTASIELTSDYENAVSVELQLALGTMKLEGTANAITKEQANALLQLWTSFSTLSQSMMPDMSSMGQGQAGATPQQPTVNEEAQTQLDELTKQIQSTLTVEQIQAIADMKITQETSQTLMQELGLEITGPQGLDGGQGQMPQGTPPAGGPGGQPPSGDQTLGTPPADGGQMRGGGFIQPQVLEAVIQLLEGKAGS